MRNESVIRYHYVAGSERYRQTAFRQCKPCAEKVGRIGARYNLASMFLPSLNSAVTVSHIGPTV